MVNQRFLDDENTRISFRDIGDHLSNVLFCMIGTSVMK